MRTLSFLFALGAVVEIQSALGSENEHAPCQNDGVFPCVKGKITDDIANAALQIVHDRRAAIDRDPEEAVQRGWAVALKDRDGNVVGYGPFGDQCKIFVQWVMNGSGFGGSDLGAGYRDAYCNCGYEIDPSDAVRGDVIQISNSQDPAAWLHVHTAIVLENRGSGVFYVIDSNLDPPNKEIISDHDFEPITWAKKYPGAYLFIADQAKRDEAKKRWDDEEKQHWNAHFYRLAPLPNQVSGSPGTPPATPHHLYPVADYFLGHESALGTAISPAYEGVGGTYQDFEHGRLLRLQATGTVRVLTYPTGVSPGDLSADVEPIIEDQGIKGLPRRAFQRAYGRHIAANGRNLLGFPYDNGGDAKVHYWGNLIVQDFYQPEYPRYGLQGKSALIFNGVEAIVVRDDFWEEFKRLPDIYGRPACDVGVFIDYQGDVDGHVGRIYLRQEFDLYSLLWHPGQTIISKAMPYRYWWHCGDVGAGISAQPLTLTGWAVSNAQVYLRSTGGIELDQHGYQAWYIDGVERAVTYSPQATITGLEPGATHRFSTVQIQNNELVASSDEFTLTMPPAEEFSLSANLRSANAVELSIVNRRFGVVGYYRILRNGVQIGQLSGEAFGDFGLAYATTYAYQVVAMTSSHLELGRSNTVSITTAAASTDPPPVEAKPASIQLSVDRIELRASERAQATALVLDQYGRPMLGQQVYFISANGSIASIDADWGSIIADREGRVDLHAELVADRNLWSPPLTLIVHRADWTPPVPPAWHVIALNEPLQLDSSGRHWSDPGHEAWVGGDSVTWVTLPRTFSRVHQYWMPQHFGGGVEPRDGFTWYPADGRLGVGLQTIHGCELWVNGTRVGTWGNPYGFGTQPINLPALGNSLSVPLVEITPYLKEGLNHVVLYVSSGFGWPELRSLEFVNLNGAPTPVVALPNLVCRIEPVGELTAEEALSVPVVVENLSPSACGASTLVLSVDGVRVQTLSVPELAAGGSHRCTVGLGPLTVGSHTATALADSAGAIAESDEANLAQLDLAILPVRRPDLLVDVELPGLTWQGELIAVTITVPNLGDGRSPPCQLLCGYGGTTDESLQGSSAGELTFIVPELAPGEVTTFSTMLRLAAADTFSFWADVDAGGEVRELDEANNVVSAEVVVEQYPPLASLPSPAYTFLSTEEYSTATGEWTRYRLRCLNWSEYPNVIFRPEASVVCGVPNAARTWVDIWAVNAVGSRSYLYGFCRLSSAQHLNEVWFSQSRSVLPPLYVCVTLTDEVVGTVLTSNLVAIPRPPGVVFSDNFESGLGKWRLNAAGSGSDPVVGRRSYPYGGKLASNGGYVLYLGDSTAGSYCTATAEFSVNLTGYTAAVLEFDWSTYSLYSPEGVFVDVFDGQWTTSVAVNRAAGWRHVAVDLSRFRLTSGMIIRFRSYQNYPESSDAAYVDNVKLTAR